MSKTQTVRQTGPAAPVPAAAVATGLLQRQCACGQHATGGECRECRKHREEAKVEVPGIVREVLASSGEPLDPGARAFLEPRFQGGFSSIPAWSSPPGSLSVGHANDPLERAADFVAGEALGATPSTGDAADFTRVRVHRGPKAAAAAKAVNARAFTIGHHLVFADGEYRPHTSSGQRLLAHELAHVLQQTGAVIRRRVAQDEAASAAPKADTDANQRQPEEDPDEKRADKPADVPDSKFAAKAAVNPVQTKTEAAGPSSAAKPVAAKPASTGGGEAQPESIGDLATGDLALVDTELAEHQRWATATAMVGAAESSDRAQFIAKQGGKASNFVASAGKGAAMSAGIKIAEKLIGKVVLKLAVKRLGAQAGKFVPVPGVGAMIGGAMSVYSLATRDWSATGKEIAAWGTGHSYYDQLANDIQAISTVLEIVTDILNVIAGIIGAISFGMWAISIVTLGIASPLALTLSAIAGAIGLASLVIDGINAVVLKELITVFRVLDSFTSDADPSDVIKQGDAVEKSAGAATGFLGGLAGAQAVEHGVKIGSGKKSPPPSEHKTPPAATGEGSTIKGEVPPEGLKPAPAEAKAPAESGGPSADTPAPKAPVTVDVPPPPEIAPPQKAQVPEGAKGAAPKGETPQAATPKAEAPKAPAPPSEVPQSSPQPTDVVKATPAEPAKSTSPKSETPKPKASKAEGAQGAAGSESPKGEKPPAHEGDGKAGKGDTVDAEIDAAIDNAKSGPLVRVGVTPEATPATVLEVGAGRHETNLGLPPEPELVQRRQTDLNPSRPGVESLDATGPVPDHLKGAHDAVIINNPHGYDPNIPELGKALKPQGQIIIQGKGETFPGERGTNGPFNRTVRDSAPPGFTKTIDVKPSEGHGHPEQILGGPFYGTGGQPIGQPNGRVIFEKVPGAPAAEPGGTHAGPAPGPESGPKSASPTGAGTETKVPAAPEVKFSAKEAPGSQAEAKGEAKEAPGKPKRRPSSKSKPGPEAPLEEIRIEAKAEPKAEPASPEVEAGGGDKGGSKPPQPPKGRGAGGEEPTRKQPRKRAKKAAEPEKTPEEIRNDDIRETMADEIAGKRNMIARDRVDSAIYDTPGKKPGRPRPAKAQQENAQDTKPKQVPLRDTGRPQNVPPGFEKSARRQSRKGAIKDLHEGITDIEKSNSRTLETRDTLLSDQEVHFLETGELPEGYENAHLASVADNPETAHKSEVSRMLPGKTDHRIGDHAGQPEIPLETMSPRDPNWQKNWGWQAGSAEDVASQSKLKWRQAESDAGIRKSGAGKPAELQEKAATQRKAAEKAREQAAKTREAHGKVEDPNSDEARKLEAKAQAQETRAAEADEQARTLDRHAKQWEEGLPELKDKMEADKAAKKAAKAAAKSGGKKPDGSGGSAPVSPAPGGAGSGGSSAQPADATLQPEAPVEPGPKVQPTAPAQPAAPTSSVETAPDTMPPQTVSRAAVEPKTEAPKAPPVPAPAETKVAPLAMTPSVEPEPKVAVPPQPEPESAKPLPPPPPPKSLQTKPASAGPETPARTPSAPEPPGSSPGGPKGVQTPPIAKPQATDKAKAEEQSIVRHVNPHYVPPPCTPEQITFVQKDILQALEARAEAERIASAMGKQEKHHKENEKPLDDMQKGTTKQITATEAAQQAVARRTETNGKMQDKEKTVSGKVDTYWEKAGELAAIKVPMKAFKAFTGLAYSLPDSPGILENVKGNLIVMNRDTATFLRKLDETDQAMNDQKSNQPKRNEKLTDDKKTLDDTGEKTDDSKDTLDATKDKAEELDKDNKAHGDEAKKAKTDASSNAYGLKKDADQKTEKVKSMAAALNEWAQNHHKARMDAIEQTKREMQARGYKITEVKEL